MKTLKKADWKKIHSINVCIESIIVVNNKVADKHFLCEGCFPALYCFGCDVIMLQGKHYFDVSLFKLESQALKSLDFQSPFRKRSFFASEEPIKKVLQRKWLEYDL